jgi:hypothetical protein
MRVLSLGATNQGLTKASCASSYTQRYETSRRSAAQAANYESTPSVRYRTERPAQLARRSNSDYGNPVPSKGRALQPVAAGSGHPNSHTCPLVASLRTAVYSAAWPIMFGRPCVIRRALGVITPEQPPVRRVLDVVPVGRVVPLTGTVPSGGTETRPAAVVAVADSAAKSPRSVNRRTLTPH